MNIDPPDERRRDYKKIDDLIERFSDVEIKLALLINQSAADHKSLRESVQRNENQLHKHDETLFGNGHPGLTSRIERINDLRDAVDAHITTDKWLFTTVIGLLVVILGKIFVQIK